MIKLCCGRLARFAFCFVLLFVVALARSDPKPNVLLITIDTLRADRLGCYGYDGAKTPHIDRFASEGVLFQDAVSHVPLTRPSHASIFTGLYPYQHGIHDNIAQSIDPKIPLLAEILNAKGYSTSAFIASFVLNSQSGLQRGFDLYEDRFDPEDQPTTFSLTLEKTGGKIYDEFAAWLSQNRARPYFAWVHLYDPHFPYEPPQPYAAHFANRPYDGEVAFSDEIVGKVVEKAGNNTLVIITSDHGESLGEHGENAHSYFMYDATLKVPLIMRWPGVVPAGRKVSIQTRLIDLFPTILDLLNISASAKVSGISLKPWIQNPAAPKSNLPSYGETFTPFLHFGWSRLQGVRTAGWKYIHAPEAELYDLRSDPGELKNVIKQAPVRARELRSWLEKSGALKSEAQASPPPTEIDPETLEKLASLGYAGVSPGPSATLADPKTKLEDFKLFNRLIREGIEDFQNKNYASAANKFQQLRDRQIPSFEVHYYLGRSLMKTKSYARAQVELQMAVDKLPHFLPAYRDLSEAYESAGNLKMAEATLRAGMKISPHHPSLVHPLAWFYQKQKKYTVAEEVLVAALKEHPADLEARYRLGAIYRDTNRTSAAIEQMKHILKQNPDEAEAHNQLGMIYGATGNNEAAADQFASAIKLDPKNSAYQKNLETARSRLDHNLRFEIIQTKTRAAADLILRKLKAGEPWEQLRKDFSIHPSARSNRPTLEASPSEINQAFLQALNQMKAGQISPAIETQGSFYILRKL